MSTTNISRKKKKIEESSFNVPVSLSQSISQFLEKKIIERKLDAGARLVPEEIAESLNVSKSPVREALLNLQKEGLVANIPRIGFFVAEINLEDIDEIYPIRAALNALMVKTIIQKGYNSTFIKNVENYIGKMEKCVQKEEVEGYFYLNVQLYNFLSENCPNYRLNLMANQLGKQVLRFRLLGMSPPGRIKRSFELNCTLATAIKNKDASLSAETAEKIVYEGHVALRNLLGGKNSETESN